MKKLIAMIGAVAMSFGLFADGPTLFSTSFETGDDGVSELTWTPGTSWSGLTGPLTLKTGDRVLPTGYGAESDDDPMTRRDSKFQAVDTNNNWLELSTGSDELTLAVESGNKVVDQLVKFTGFDTAPTVEDGKIAVWMSEFVDENDEDVTYTNLYVTCGKVTELGTAQVTLQIDKAYELDKWYRLSIFSLADGTADSYNGFKIFIDGELITSAEATTIAPTDDMPAKVKSLMAKGALFPSLDEESAAIASVSYKGIGAIDDIIVDENGPAFRTDATVTIPALAFATATGYKVGEDGEIIPLTGNTFDVEPGSEVTVFFAPVGTKLLTKDSYTVTVDDSMTLDAAAIEAALQPKDIVATVDEEFNYATLADALAKVQELEVSGNEVTIAISKTVDAETIPGAGVLGFDNGTMIVVNTENTPGVWTIAGNARLGANIAADKTVVVTQIPETEIGGALAYAGEVAGSLSAATLTKLSEGAITIAEGGAVTVGTQITEYATFFTAPTGFQVKETANVEDGTWTYTVEKEKSTITVTLVNTPEVATVTGLVDGQKVTEGDEVKFTVELKEGFKSLKVQGAEPTATANEFAFTAGKTDVTITITADAMVYATIPTITETFTYNGTEQTAIEDDDGYEVVSGGKGTNADSYTAVVKLAAGYDAWTDKTTANKEIQWSIGQAAVTVTAVNQTIKVGETPAEYTATVSPAPFGTDEIDYTVTCPTYVDAEGTYDIVVTPSTNPNYAVTPVNGTLTVEKAAPTRPTVIDGGSQAQKDAYDAWAAAQTAAGKTVDPAAPHTLNCFILGEDLDTTEAALETKLAAEITDAMLKDLVAKGTVYTGDFTLEKYPNATFTFEVTEEIPSVEGVSKFWRLKAFFKPANAKVD